MFIVADVMHMLCKVLDLSDDRRYNFEIFANGERLGMFDLNRKLLLNNQSSSDITRREVNTFTEKHIGIYNSLQIVRSIYRMGNSFLIGCASIIVENPAQNMFIKCHPYTNNTIVQVMQDYERHIGNLFENREKVYSFIEITEDGNWVLEYESEKIGIPDRLQKSINGKVRAFQFPYIVIYNDRVRVNLLHKFIDAPQEQHLIES